ncbi:MAG: hypothetical protein GC151_13960 [Betaproteobacteria bacterium]|nr:hypothetical protein [Betaproteobacteria bacterium]
MTAISKTFTAVSDAQVDADSPLTESLLTALRDNAIHLREWLGASFTAGAVQDHNHDGVNSALIEVGPNYVRNGSFESGESGWTFQDFAGGAHAINSSGGANGTKRLAITSTVLANGGGQAITNDYISVGDNEPISMQWWVHASTSGVSANVQVLWYDSAKSLISQSDIYSVTSAPTSASRYVGRVAAPTNARYFRIKVVGGVPASGSAVGTVYYDGIVVTRAIEQSNIWTGQIGQAEIRTSTGSVSVVSGSGHFALPGGEYGFYPQLRGTGGTVTANIASGYIATGSNVTVIYLNASLAGYATQRYVQASPPYDLGNGDVPLFVFAEVDRSTGAVVSAWAAEDPPWANNGPTCIRADVMLGSRKFRYARPNGRELVDRLRAGRITADAMAKALCAPPDLIEITQDVKQADMAAIPHPFVAHDGAARRVVMLDPIGASAEQLQALQRDGAWVADLLMSGDIVLDSEPLTAKAPPGVMPVGWKWKSNQGVSP